MEEGVLNKDSSQTIGENSTFGEMFVKVISCFLYVTVFFFFLNVLIKSYIV